MTVGTHTVGFMHNFHLYPHVYCIRFTLVPTLRVTDDRKTSGHTILPNWLFQAPSMLEALWWILTVNTNTFTRVSSALGQLYVSSTERFCPVFHYFSVQPPDQLVFHKFLGVYIYSYRRSLLFKHQRMIGYTS